MLGPVVPVLPAVVARRMCPVNRNIAIEHVRKTYCFF